MIKIYKNKIVVFSRNYKRVFMFSIIPDAYQWLDTASGDCYFASRLYSLKDGIKEVTQEIARTILEKHCKHNEVPDGKFTMCNKCRKTLNYKPAT